MKTKEIKKSEKETAKNGQSNGTRQSKKTKSISEISSDELTVLAWKTAYENHQMSKADLLTLQAWKRTYENHQKGKRVK